MKYDYDPSFSLKGDFLDQAKDRARDRRLDRLVARHAEQMNRAKEYTNIIIVAGYAAFFGLWAGIAQDIDVRARATAAALLTLSLMAFISWEIISMYYRAESHKPFNELLLQTPYESEFEDSWDAAVAANERIYNRYIKAWPWFLIISVFTGLCGAAILFGAAAAKGLGY